MRNMKAYKNNHLDLKPGRGNYVFHGILMQNPAADPFYLNFYLNNNSWSISFINDRIWKIDFTHIINNNSNKA